MKFLTTILAFLAIGFAYAPVSAETRALVMASNYDLLDADPALFLANPLEDSSIVASALEKGSVDSLTVVREPTIKDWTKTFDKFVASLGPDDIALLYYAGHGLQIEGRNYFLASDGVSLIPLDPGCRS